MSCMAMKKTKRKNDNGSSSSKIIRRCISESGEDKHDAYNVDDGHLPKNVDNS